MDPKLRALVFIIVVVISSTAFVVSRSLEAEGRPRRESCECQELRRIRQILEKTLCTNAACPGDGTPGGGGPLE